MTINTLRRYPPIMVPPTPVPTQAEIVLGTATKSMGLISAGLLVASFLFPPLFTGFLIAITLTIILLAVTSAASAINPTGK
ncbi:MAG TPA: hypothetical protein VLF94_06285 [Chlamydiales bacterium]|nr:hypothetical protein [Chlamydiales bacterium]